MYSKEKIIETVKDIKETARKIKPYVVVAQPRRVKEETPAQNLKDFNNLHVHFNGVSRGFIDIYGEKVDVARNYLMDMCIESGAKYMFFVGEDTVAPFYAFEKLHEVAEKNPDAVVTGVYYMKISGPMIMKNENGYVYMPNCDPGQVIEVDQTGMDCMLIPISILKAMKEAEPDLPFCCIYPGDDELPFIGEDNFFVHRLKKHGYRLLVNTDVQCLHMDLATGKYTAHPSVDLKHYMTNIPIADELTYDDKKFIDERWVNRLPEGTGAKKQEESINESSISVHSEE
jgi:hypothetical protein